MLKVIGGDWKANSYAIVKRKGGGLGAPNALTLPKSTFSHEDVSTRDIVRIEVLASADAEVLRGRDDIRQAAALYFAVEGKRPNTVLAFVEVVGARFALLAGNSSDATELLSLLQSMRTADQGVSSVGGKDRPRIGLFLGVGLVFVPIVFVWFLLRKGHSSGARIAAFVWTVAFLGLVAIGGSPPKNSALVPPTNTAPAKLAVTQPSAEQSKADFLATHQLFMDQVKRCDAAWDHITTVLQGGDSYESYEAAKSGAEICRDAGMSMNDIRFQESIPSETRGKLNDAMSDCSLALLMRASALDQAANIFDGNSRPSSLSEFKSRGESAQAATFQCVGRYVVAAVGGGYEVSEEGR